MFQSTRPRGARLSFVKSLSIITVSIHAPTRGATGGQEQAIDERWFQSTRPCGARRFIFIACPQPQVSIHAPTRGATPYIRYDIAIVSFNPRAHAGRDSFTPRAAISPVLFQSTRPRGARRRRPKCPPIYVCFNPRAHAGRDPNLSHTCSFSCVSIHAPTRGATSAPNLRGLNERFNPRAHAGRDRGLVLFLTRRTVSIHAPMRGATLFTVKKSTRTVFQSTRPRGARRACTLLGLWWRCFNPRAHAGRDSANEKLHYFDKVSIHAPMRGATNTFQCFSSIDQFQSTRPCGARPSSCALMMCVVVSIHAPMRGATSYANW